jgi:uncharacterized repeat protein (TIGR02543 family)
MDRHAREGLQGVRAYARAQGIAVAGDGVTVIGVPAAGARPATLARALARKGARVVRTGKGHVKARVPLARLQAIASDVRSLGHLELRVVPNGANTVITEARGNDNWTNALNWHGHGFRGQGVRIAVIDIGFNGLAALKAADEVPSTAIEVDLSGTGMETGSSHGCPSAEIVYDMAPEAQFYLIKAADLSDLEAATDYCIANGIHIVNHSVVHYNCNFYDGEVYPSLTHSPVAYANEATSNGILWVNSAGNEQQRHALIQWSDSYGYCKWASDGTNLNQIGYWSAGSNINLRLTWNCWPWTDQDFDLLLYYFVDGLGWIVCRASQNLQNGTQPPIEEIDFTVAGGAYFAVAISRSSATTSPTFILRSWNQNLTYKGYDQMTPAPGSIGCPADAASVLTVGAIDEDNYRVGPVQSYSALGPNNRAYTGGTALVKPDITSADAVAAASCPPPAYPNGAEGTTVASPHIAGLAALVRSRFPSYTNTQLRQYLEASTIDLAPTGKDNTFGYGPCVLGKVWSLTMAVNTAGWGTTTPAAPGAYITDDGTAVPITATPASGYVFKNWTGDGVADPNSPSTTVSMSADTTVTAVFEASTLGITVTPTSWDIAGVQPQAGTCLTVGGTRFTVQNTGGVTETLRLRISDEDNQGKWHAGSDTGPEQYWLRALFVGSADTPAAGDYGSEDTLTTSVLPATSTRFNRPAGTHGVSMAVDAFAYLWFRLDLPSSVTDGDQHQITVEVSCETP